MDFTECCSAICEIRKNEHFSSDNSCSALKQVVRTNDLVVDSLYKILQTHAITLQKLDEAESRIDTLCREKEQLCREVERISTMLMNAKHEQHKLSTALNTHTIIDNTLDSTLQMQCEELVVH